MSHGGRRQLLAEELVLHIFSFLDALSLTMARGINKNSRRLADESPSWSLLCMQLWQGKQFHPWERWVCIQPENPDEGEIVRGKVELLAILLLYQGAHPEKELELIHHHARLIALFSRKRRAAPVSRILREQQIILENRLYDEDAEPADLVVSSMNSAVADQVVKNITSEFILTKEILEDFRRRGELLSWRESYIASIIDSTRCCPTYSVSYFLKAFY